MGAKKKTTRKKTTKKKTTRKKTGRKKAPSRPIPTAKEPDDTPAVAAVAEKLASGEIFMGDLQALTAGELLALAHREELEDCFGLNKQDLIFKILRNRGEEEETLYGEGVLEILPDGFGFLRSTNYSYTASPDDIYVAPSQIRRLGLRGGCHVAGQIRAPKEGERYFALVQVDEVNRDKPELAATRPVFEELTALYPDKRLMLETTPDIVETRIIDLLSPIGLGQRGLIVAPPRVGKTIILQLIANAISTNHPSATSSSCCSTSGRKKSRTCSATRRPRSCPRRSTKRRRATARSPRW